MVGLDNPLHIALVLVVVLLVFGAKRLPEMGKSMGAGLRGFKDSLQGESSDEVHSPGQMLTQAADEPAVTPVAAAPVAAAPVAAAPVAPTQVESTPPAA